MDRGMQHMDELINELSELCGIFAEYWDIFGKKHVTSVETKKAILRSMKLKIDSVEDLVKVINERKWEPWKSFIEPVHVISVNNQPLAIPVYIPVKEGEETKLIISWSIEDENNPSSPPYIPPYQGGTKRGKGGKAEFSHKNDFILTGDAITISELQWINGTRYIKINLIDTAHRHIGYYLIQVECKHPENIFPGGVNLLNKTSKIIITPDTCYIPPELQRGRAWGLAINLYSIRSARNFGIGDFKDLKKIVRWVADLGGSFVGINPLHAIPNTKPFGISPYSPLSRLYKNFIYLDVENIPEITESEDVREIIIPENFNKELDELRKGDLVDYEKVASLKEKILKNAFVLFYKKHYTRNTRCGREFKKYIAEESTALEYFATYMALSDQFGVRSSKFENSPSPTFTKGGGKGRSIDSSLFTYHSSLLSWQEWPEKYHNILSKTVQAFRKSNKKEILFYKYVQWLIARQLKEVVEEARNLGMAVGLYHDLAIGSIGRGSDAWSYQGVIAGETDVGSPPDDFNLYGQNWGFPPLIPEKLEDTGYELFIQTIRNNMKYGGALRIDHALGMFRLFWIPQDMSPKEGAYINYPSEDLLRIVALESVRNKTLVIAEDLGTIGENVRETLERFHMLSYRLFYFERNYPEPSFIPPDKYPDMALCAITTHDLPTIYGYWAGQDLKVKKQLGMYPDNNFWQEQVNERERDKQRILSALKSQGIIPDDCQAEEKMTPELGLAIYQYLALTPCKLLLVSLDDIIGTLNQQNMPGTVDEHPNWMQKILLTYEEMISDKRFTALSTMLRNTIANIVTPG
jgi:4-alpha-glucanotransferase